eukprot:GILI01012162.1.p1 GENE.GILI01012162.1~~GILI01012162.1.p1  ORF type:complete len:544 (+),score=52.93 GILI01012162.1:45-1634(+)
MQQAMRRKPHTLVVSPIIPKKQPARKAPEPEPAVAKVVEPTPAPSVGWRRIPVPPWTDNRGAILKDALRGIILNYCLSCGFASVAPTLTFISMAELRAAGRTLAEPGSKRFVFGTRAHKNYKLKGVAFALRVSPGRECATDVVNAAFTCAVSGSRPSLGHLTPQRNISTCEPIPLESEGCAHPLVLQPAWEWLPGAKGPTLIKSIPEGLSRLLPPESHLLPFDDFLAMTHPTFAFWCKVAGACGPSVLVWHNEADGNISLGFKAQKAVTHSTFTTGFLQLLLGPSASVPVSTLATSNYMASYSAKGQDGAQMKVSVQTQKVDAPCVFFRVPITHLCDLGEPAQLRIASLLQYQPLLVHSGSLYQTGLFESADHSALGLRYPGDPSVNLPMVRSEFNSTLFWLLSLAAHQRAALDFPTKEALSVAETHWMPWMGLASGHCDVHGAAEAHQFLLDRIEPPLDSSEKDAKIKTIGGEFALKVQERQLTYRILHHLPTSSSTMSECTRCRWQLTGTAVIDGMHAFVLLRERNL